MSASDNDVRESLEAYQHFMSVRPQDLLAEYVSSSGRANRDITPAMQMAFERRIEEMEDYLLEAEHAMEFFEEEN